MNKAVLEIKTTFWNQEGKLEKSTISSNEIFPRNIISFSNQTPGSFTVIGITDYNALLYIQDMAFYNTDTKTINLLKSKYFILVDQKTPFVIYSKTMDAGTRYELLLKKIDVDPKSDSKYQIDLDSYLILLGAIVEDAFQYYDEIKTGKQLGISETQIEVVIREFSDLVKKLKARDFPEQNISWFKSPEFVLKEWPVTDKNQLGEKICMAATLLEKNLVNLSK